jgi:hypothetical protein
MEAMLRQAAPDPAVCSRLAPRAQVVVQQHQLLARSSYDGHYEPLLDAEEAAAGSRGKRW